MCFEFPIIHFVNPCTSIQHLTSTFVPEKDTSTTTLDRPQEDLWLHLWSVSRSRLNRNQNHAVSSVFVVHFINCIVSRKFPLLSFYAHNIFFVWFYLYTAAFDCFSCSTFSHLVSSHFDYYKYLIIHFPRGFSGIIYNTGWGTLSDCLRCSLQVWRNE